MRHACRGGWFGIGFGWSSEAFQDLNLVVVLIHDRHAGGKTDGAFLVSVSHRTLRLVLPASSITGRLVHFQYEYSYKLTREPYYSKTFLEQMAPKY